ncbi:hypothetical protein KR222_010214, partial [Zaprionus bogoriensis]
VSLALLSICLLSGARAQCIDTYEPGCLLQAEVGQAYRHCIDPTKFWWCSQQNVAAQLNKCPPNTGFDQAMHACIPWIDWVWKTC